jgi:hypothetical protein
MSSSMLRGLLIKFLKSVSTTARSSINFYWSGYSFARLLIMTEKRRGPLF